MATLPIEALPSNKFRSIVGTILHLFDKTQTLFEWSHQPSPCVVSIAILGSFCSYVDKLGVLPSRWHIPFWGCRTLPSNCGRDQRVWPSISTSSSPSPRPPNPLKSCPGFALHLPNVVVATRFFSMNCCNSNCWFYFFGKCFVLAFQQFHLHLSIWTFFQSCLKIVQRPSDLPTLIKGSIVAQLVSN